MAENFLSSVYNSLRHSKHAIVHLTPATCVNIMQIIYLFIYLLPDHMFFNTVIEDADQLSSLHGIVRDLTGRSMHWMASIKS